MDCLFIVIISYSWIRIIRGEERDQDESLPARRDYFASCSLAVIRVTKQYHVNNTQSRFSTFTSTSTIIIIRLFLEGDILASHISLVATAGK